jgi:hypothetical protein
MIDKTIRYPIDDTVMYTQSIPSVSDSSVTWIGFLFILTNMLVTPFAVIYSLVW